MQIRKASAHHSEFKQEKNYYRPSYAKIEFDGKHFRIIKSKEKKEDFYPMSVFHNPLKTRSRFLNLINKYCKKNDRHLNIGFGVGDYEVFLSKLPIQLYSIDHPDAPALQQDAAKSNIALSKTQLSTADIFSSKLPFKDNFFDSISLLEILEHLPVQKIPFAISEIKRVLKTNGYLYLSTPNLASLENRLILMFKGKLFLYLPKEGETIFDHLRTYTRSEIMKLFKDRNFRLVEEIFFSDNITWKAQGNIFHIIQSYFLKILIKLNKNFNNSLMFVMQKA
ncbi:MAG: class I SAM-dependent methyltransferase [Candidatus Omnitrophota bacterium]